VSGQLGRDQVVERAVTCLEFAQLFQVVAEALPGIVHDGGFFGGIEQIEELCGEELFDQGEPGREVPVERADRDIGLAGNAFQ
jgi:hypothetical protein